MHLHAILLDSMTRGFDDTRSRWSGHPGEQADNRVGPPASSQRTLHWGMNWRAVAMGSMRASARGGIGSPAHRMLNTLPSSPDEVLL
jgi:hypothetical protein